MKGDRRLRNWGGGIAGVLLQVVSDSGTAIVQYQERHAADPMMTWAEISRARSLLGWTPAIGIEEVFRRTVDWYMSNRDWARTLR